MVRVEGHIREPESPRAVGSGGAVPSANWVANLDFCIWNHGTRSVEYRTIHRPGITDRLCGCEGYGET
jgi:hypothetical protein